MAAVHIVKSWPQFFQAIEERRKTAELRRNDRHYKIGDILLLQEFNPDDEQYSGREMKVEITHLISLETTCAVSNEALHQDFAILSVRKI